MSLERLERIEDAILELAEAIEDGETFNLSKRVGEVLFEEPKASK